MRILQIRPKQWLRFSPLPTLAVLVVVVSGPAVADPVVTLDELMQTAFKDAPDLAIARQQRAAGEAVLRQASAAFDPTFDASLTLSYQQGELLPPARRRQEGNRELLSTLDEEFRSIADELELGLAENDGPVGIDCGDGNQIIIDGEDICEDSATRRQRVEFAQLLERLIDSELDPQQREQFEALRDSNIADNRAAIRGVIDELRLQALALRNTLRQLGGVPPVEEESSLVLDLGYSLPLRNGQTLRPQLLVEGVNDVFRNKPRNASLGGKGEPFRVRSAVGFTWTVPFGRGGGRVSAEAPERAARHSLQARQQQQRFTASRLARDLSEVYWRLAAAGERIELQRQQVERQQRLVTLSQALAEADELPAADSQQARAARYQADSILMQRQAEQRALRLQLALLAGLPVESLAETPLPAQTVPAVPETLCSFDALNLSQQAAAKRADLSALARLRDASDVQLAAAQADRRARLDFNLTVAFSALQEGTPVGEAFAESLTSDFIGPSLFIGLSGELPWRNDRARGVYQQAVAQASQAQTRWLEGHRAIYTEVSAQVSALEQAAQQARWRTQAVAAFDGMVEADRARLRDARATVIDVLIAQEQLHAARLAELAAREAFWLAAVRLRHAIDALVIYHPSDGEPIGLHAVTQPPCPGETPTAEMVSAVATAITTR